METITYQPKPTPKSTDPTTFSPYECAPEQLHKQTMTILGKKLNPILIDEVAESLSDKIYRWLLHVNAPKLIMTAFISSNILRDFLLDNLVPITEAEPEYYDQLMNIFMEGISALTEFGGQFFEKTSTKELKPFIYE